MAANAIPTYFGPEDARLFGWLHLPDNGVARNVGVVVCNPFGYEFICTHRTVRTIAQIGADNGFAVMRFDYEGTGDSSGTDLAPDRPRVWLAGIAAAIQHLKQTTGVTQIALLGVRLGATLAVLAAECCIDIEAIIAFAPIINGRKYVRELRSLSLASSAASATTNATPSNADGLQETAGFATTEATRTEIAKLDLLQRTTRPAGRVLILHRDDLPTDESWYRHLQAQQVDVHQTPLKGYIGMMSDPHENHVPVASIDAAFSWLAGPHDNAASISLSKATAAVMQMTLAVTHADKTTPIRELLAFTDPARTQFGILSDSMGDSSGDSMGDAMRDKVNGPKQVLILLSSGAVSRPGPNRLYVTLARICAAANIAVLRLDISGIGDSAAHEGEPGNVVYTPFAKQDIAQAIEFVTAHYGVVEIHLAGVCSGGFHGLKAAAAGLPIRSVVVINPLTFFWEPGMTLAYPAFQSTAEAMRYRRNAMQFSSWLKLLRGKVDVAAAFKVAGRRVAELIKSTARNLCRLCNIKLKNDLGGELQQIASRDVDMHFIFAATDPGFAMLREQSGIVLSRLIKRGKLRTSVIDDADHTFTSKRSRDTLVAIVAAHLTAYGKKSSAG